jgi:hypothetical protein
MLAQVYPQLEHHVGLRADLWYLVWLHIGLLDLQAKDSAVHCQAPHCWLCYHYGTCGHVSLRLAVLPAGLTVFAADWLLRLSTTSRTRSTRLRQPQLQQLHGAQHQRLTPQPITPQPPPTRLNTTSLRQIVIPSLVSRCSGWRGSTRVCSIDPPLRKGAIRLTSLVYTCV